MKRKETHGAIYVYAFAHLLDDDNVFIECLVWTATPKIEPPHKNG